MFDKIMQAQRQMEAVKARLETITVSEHLQGGAIKICATASRKITEFKIDPDFLKNVNAEELEELLVVAMNRVLEKAEKVNEAEMQGAAKDMLPGFSGLFGK
jgi:DNA-binding protein YbaB